MGLLRLFLALSVIAGHAESTVFGFNGIGAWYAVNFFFIISGFYMAMVLNEKYRDVDPLVFYKSRALRLFPTYYIGLAIALCVSFTNIAKFFEFLQPASRVFFVLQNLFIIGQDVSYLVCAKTILASCAWPMAMTINPPAWSLAVELGFYFIAPFFVKSVRNTFALLLVGCAYLISINGIDFPITSLHYIRPGDVTAFNYYLYPSSFVFFAGGALAYHFSKSDSKPNYLLALATVVALSFTTTTMPFWHLLFFSMAIPVLFRFTAKNRFDRAIGELSYPAYILHFPILKAIIPVAKSHPNVFQVLSIGTWVATISCALGYVIYQFVEKRINAYRESKVFVEPTDNRGGWSAKLAMRTAMGAFFALPTMVVAHVYYVSEHMPISMTPYNLTDANWVNGVSRKDASFFISDNRANARTFKPGVTITFSNGDSRTVSRIDTSGPYLNVYLDGSPMDGNEVGYPHTYTIQN